MAGYKFVGRIIRFPVVNVINERIYLVRLQSLRVYKRNDIPKPRHGGNSLAVLQQPVDLWSRGSVCRTTDLRATGIGKCEVSRRFQQEHWPVALACRPWNVTAIRHKLSFIYTLHIFLFYLAPPPTKLSCREKRNLDQCRGVYVTDAPNSYTGLKFIYGVFIFIYRPKQKVGFKQTPCMNSRFIYLIFSLVIPLVHAQENINMCSLHEKYLYLHISPYTVKIWKFLIQNCFSAVIPSLCIYFRFVSYQLHQALLVSISKREKSFEQF